MILYPIPTCGVFPHMTKQFSDTSWVSYGSTQFNSLSTWRYHQIPQVKGSILQGGLPLQIPIASPGCLLCFWSTDYRLEIPTTPFLGWINLLEKLTKLRETLCLLDYQFIIKECNSETARWKRCMGQSMWEGAWSFHALSMCATLPTSPIVHQHRSSPNSFLWGFYGGFLI